MIVQLTSSGGGRGPQPIGAVRSVPLQRAPDMIEQSNEPDPIQAQPTANADASAAQDTKSAQTPPKADPAPPEPESRRWKRKLVFGVLGIAVLSALIVFGIPAVKETLNTVSTDDAYVNGHVTFVAPRVAGQISRVLVDDNNRVHKGDLLAELDKEPYRVAVSEKQAAVDTAKADLQAAIAAARAIEAQARSRRWNLQHAVEDVDNQVALLHARVATVEKSKAALALAQLEFDRARQLVARADVSREVYDQRQAELTTAGAGLTQTLGAKSTKSASRWGCRPNLTGAAISARCRPISTRLFRPSLRRRRSSFRAPLSSASCTRSTRVRKR